MEIISLLILGVVIVISPGADFALVLKNSINNGRRSGIYTALGISLAITVHIGYSLMGIGYLISHSQWLFELIRYAGALYLIYLGIKGLISVSTSITPEKGVSLTTSRQQYLAQGFLCNVLNPKTMLFFLSIFSQVMSLNNGSTIAPVYGLYIMLLHLMWFTSVALLFTSERLSSALTRYHTRINNLCAIALIGFGVLLGLKPGH
ncbi:LysE family transporter [Shewanella sp. KX20019]|uniref:LysE family translocator n=1 Tax=Shewanella sp. KX20019 TaxID=2803864 RepID=UPI0019290BB3|nr:LysE family transporter [Shewanella sp. KX20019]QQX80900.1 LysE family transporter [Shewanella sp. KX20019]